MFEIGNYVVYKNQVCIIKDLRINFFKGKDYYVLSPLLDSSLTINLPADDIENNLKAIMTKEEAIKLIESIPSIKMIESNDKMIENEYKELLKTEKEENLIKIIKTTYTRNNERLKKGKQVGEKDETYFNKAEKLLYSELAISLGMNYDEVKQYIFDTIHEVTS
ncbi:MAG: CarD family transcriptional regulator [Bacilli bacterium]|nr:CarD family transcriptional regulator [Bacilli bacterium]